MRDEDKKNELAKPETRAGGKSPWQAPRIQTLDARDGEANFTFYGGVDAGIYHS